MNSIYRIIILGCSFLMLGCGEGFKRAPVSGRVTHKGAPLADVVVQFIPVAGTKGGGAVALTDAEGNYFLKGPKQEIGVAPGEYHLRLSRLVDRAGNVLQLGATEADNPGMRETIPPPYGGAHPTKLVDVPADGAAVDIDIRTKLLDHSAHPK